MKKSISRFFEEVSAPLVNIRWSWGAVKSDGSVVLRVWQHEKFKKDQGGKHYYQLTHNELYKNRQDDNGYQERLAHVRSIMDGSPCFMVMCRAIDPDAIPRKIGSFDVERVFEGGDLTVHGNEIYVEMVRPIPVVEFLGHGAAA